MNLLLLSWGAGALPGFLAQHTGKAPADIALGYLNDAMLPYENEEFTEIDRYRLIEFGYAPTTVTARDIPSATAFAEILDGLDALYVCGGETFVLLETCAATAWLTCSSRRSAPDSPTSAYLRAR